MSGWCFLIESIHNLVMQARTSEVYLCCRGSSVELVVGWENNFGVEYVYCVIVARFCQINSDSILSLDDGDEA